MACVRRIIALLIFSYFTTHVAALNVTATLKELIKDVKDNKTLSDEMEQHLKYWKSLDTRPVVPKFQCDTRDGKSVIKPTSVHRLRPGDINVVAAIGDSISAGFMARADSVTNLLLEWRGIAWSGGGDDSLDSGVVTIPNVIKLYNPHVKGYSIGVILGLTQEFNRHKTQCNVAVSGAVSGDIKSQAKYLVESMKRNKTIDFDNDWKLVTIFIGGNDLCQYCLGDTNFNSTEYQNHIKRTLDYLHENLPRTFVNLVMILDVTQLQEINRDNLCGVFHLIECPCGSFPASEDAKQHLILESIKYSDGVLTTLASGIYDDRDDFTVVAQPSLVTLRMPTKVNGDPDLSYFAPDCFHFSEKGHASAAQAIWNNMVLLGFRRYYPNLVTAFGDTHVFKLKYTPFQPPGLKRLSWFVDEPWVCPTQDSPYLFTYRNGYIQDTNSGKKLTNNFGNSFVQNQQFKPPEEPVGSIDNPIQKTPSSGVTEIMCFFAGIVLVLVIAVVVKGIKYQKTKKQKQAPEKIPLL